MIADSQLDQLDNPRMQPCSATIVELACARCRAQTGALHMFATQMSPKAVWSRRTAKHASESVLVVGELLCTGVQANTERHTKKETREMGYKQHEERSCINKYGCLFVCWRNITSQREHVPIQGNHFISHLIIFVLQAFFFGVRAI